MDIVVLVEQFPETRAERTPPRTGHTLDREGAELVLDEIDERAAEEAMRLMETADAPISVVYESRRKPSALAVYASVNRSAASQSRPSRRGS